MVVAILMAGSATAPLTACTALDEKTEKSSGKPDDEKGNSGGEDDGTVSLSAPSGLTVTPGDKGVTLNWQPVEGAKGYKIYYGASKEALTNTASAGEPKATISDIENEKEYFFAVAAVSGRNESPRGEVVSAKPTAAGQTVAPTPSSLTVTIGDKEATLTWSPVAGAALYRIYYGTDPNDLTTMKETGAASITIEELENRKKYYFAMTAVTAGGVESAKTQVAEGTPAPATPATPSNKWDEAVWDAAAWGP